MTNMHTGWGCGHWWRGNRQVVNSWFKGPTMRTKEQSSPVFNLDTKKQKSCAWGSLAAQRLVEDQKLKKITMSCETYLWESPVFWKQMDINFTAQHVNPEQKHLLCVAQSTSLCFLVYILCFGPSFPPMMNANLFFFCHLCCSQRPWKKSSEKGV